MEEKSNTRNKREEKEYRKIKKAIAQLPKDSFNNPEKAQPAKDIIVPTVVPATLNNPVLQNEARPDKIVDSPLILDTNSKRIESVAKIKKQKSGITLLRIMGYLKKYWYLFVLAIIFAGFVEEKMTMRRYTANKPNKKLNPIPKPENALFSIT